MQLSSLFDSIVLTHFGIRSHADILENELVQLTVKAFISQVNADARGGVVAGVMNLSNAQIGCELYLSFHGYNIICGKIFSSQ